MKFPLVKREMTTKEKILYLIEIEKANTLMKIFKIVKKRHSTLMEHLQNLEREKKIKGRKMGRERIYRVK